SHFGSQEWWSPLRKHQERSDMQSLRKDMILPKLKHAIIFGICFFICARAVAHAQTNTDELSGESMFAIAIDPQDTRIIYAGSDEGVFKSTDGGVSWTRPALVSPAATRALVVDPQNSDIIWAATYNDRDDGVFKSMNGGLSWT